MDEVDPIGEPLDDALRRQYMAAIDSGEFGDTLLNEIYEYLGNK